MKIINKAQLKQMGIKPEQIFVVIALIYGLSFLFIVPPFQVPDEAAHFTKAVGLSDGYWISEKIGNKTGVTVPNGTIKLLNAFPRIMDPSHNKLTLEYIISKLNITLTGDKRSFDLSKSSIGSYAPILYIIPAFIAKLGSIFKISVLISLYLVRIANLLIWILLVYLAIRITPIFKWVLFILALMPMTLFIASSASIDGIIIGLSFLTITYILKLAFQDDQIKRKNIFVLAVLGCLLALSKPIYLLILILTLIIPKTKFKSIKYKYGSFFVLLAISGSLGIGWLLLTNGLYKPLIPDWSLLGQIQFVTSYPMTYIHIFANDVLTQTSKYLISFIGNFGWLQIPLPNLIVTLYILMIIFTALIDKNKFKISLNQKIISLIIGIMGIVGVISFEYLTWNSIGSQIINGVQGRYFIPIAPLLALLLYNNVENITFYDKTFSFKLNSLFKVFIILFVVIILSLSIFIILKYYY